jgi:hypothetical protein
MRVRFVSSALVATLIVAVSALPAAAAPDASETKVVVSPTPGFYTVTQTAEFYTDSNPDNPFPVPGNNTYIYTAHVHADSIIGLVGFGVQIIPGAANAVVDAGFIPGTGVEPSAIDIGTFEVKWTWFGEHHILPGDISAQLYIVSPFEPGPAAVTINGAFALDAPSSTDLAPAEAPDPNPCSVGFWKNRADGKPGLLQFFPGAEFDQIVTEAVALTSTFSTDAELLDALAARGRLTMEERAKHHFAGTLLNVAAANLFPDNTTCALFLANDVDTTGDGTPDMTVAEAIAQIEAWIASGDPTLHEAAKDLAEQLNHGTGVT